MEPDNHTAYGQASSFREISHPNAPSGHRTAKQELADLEREEPPLYTPGRELHTSHRAQLRDRDRRVRDRHGQTERLARTGMDSGWS